jgi:hypothetical protein
MTTAIATSAHAAAVLTTPTCHPSRRRAVSPSERSSAST